MPSFRPRISLLSALLLMTIVGMAIVLAQLWHEVGPLRQEVRLLRDEVGELSIEDETQIHAIEVRTKDPLFWKWRVWIPEGQTVVLRSQWADIPRTGVPAGDNTLAVKSGEQWITLRAKRNPNGKSWNAQVETATRSSATTIQEGDRWWEWPIQTVTGEGVGFNTKSAKEDERFVILKRWRVAGTNNATELLGNDVTTGGFIIWLERR